MTCRPLSHVQLKSTSLEISTNVNFDRFSVRVFYCGVVRLYPSIGQSKLLHHSMGLLPDILHELRCHWLVSQLCQGFTEWLTGQTALAEKTSLLARVTFVACGHLTLLRLDDSTISKIRSRLEPILT